MMRRLEDKKQDMNQNMILLNEQIEDDRVDDELRKIERNRNKNSQGFFRSGGLPPELPPGVSLPESYTRIKSDEKRLKDCPREYKTTFLMVIGVWY